MSSSLGDEVIIVFLTDFVCEFESEGMHAQGPCGRSVCVLDSVVCMKQTTF